MPAVSLITTARFCDHVSYELVMSKKSLQVKLMAYVHITL